jgi:hypothetical protein
MRRQATKQWKHLDTPQRTVMIAGGVVQLTLFAAAQIDITRRDDDEIRGSKLMWRLICLVNFIGPVLYFAFGRLTPEPATAPAEATPIVA